jgi:Zn-dependent protease
MKWAWRIGRVAGIDVFMHATFPLLLIWAGFNGYTRRHNWNDAWIGIAFVVVIFGIIVLHELGHALTARRFGIRTRDITLLPIGGVARLERMPEEPRQELLVALAGPAVNVVLAGVFFAVLAVGEHIADLTQRSLLGGNFLANLMWVNVFLAVFNLIPAFPMDGGRVLRALLASRMNYVRATNIAAKIGQGLAFAFGLIGLFHNPFWVLLALFVYAGAGHEARTVEIKSALAGTLVSDVMITDFRTLSPHAPLSQAVECLLSGHQHEFPIVEQGQLVGLLTRSALVAGLAQRGVNAPIGEVMKREYTSVGPAEPAEAVLIRLRGGDVGAVPVTEGGRILGMVTSENLGEYLAVRDALKGNLERRHWAHDFEATKAA